MADFAVTVVDGRFVVNMGWNPSLIPQVVAAEAAAAAAAASAAEAADKVSLTALAASTGAALVGSIQTGTGAVARTAQDKLRDTTSVKDFGVVGDGTNETINIQKAIDAVVARGGGRLHFPPCASFYGFTNLTVGHRVVLVGEGLTEYSASLPSSYLKKLSTGIGIIFTGDACGLDRIHIDGDDTAGDLVQAVGGRFTVRDTSLVKAGQDNLRIGDDGASNTYNSNLWRIYNLVSLDAGRYGLHIHDGKSSLLPDVNAGLLVGCDIRGNASNGLHNGVAWDNNFIGFVAQNNSGTGARFASGSKNCTMWSPYTEANSNSEIVLDSGTSYCRIEGNRSGVNAAGYVDNGTNNRILQYNTNIAGFFYNDQIVVANVAASGEASVIFCAGINQGVAGLILGREGAVGTAGEFAIQVKRNGDTPVDRLRLTDGSVIVPTGTSLLADGLKNQAGTQIIGAQGAAVADAAAATYVAPAGGATVDAESRTALAQLAADNAALRTAINTLLARERAHGLIAT